MQNWEHFLKEFRARELKAKVRAEKSRKYPALMEYEKSMYIYECDLSLVGGSHGDWRNKRQCFIKRAQKRLKDFEIEITTNKGEKNG